MYSAKDIEELNAKNIEYPDGSMHTLYEAEQQQRAFERKIRVLCTEILFLIRREYLTAIFLLRTIIVFFLPVRLQVLKDTWNPQLREFWQV